MYSQVKMQRIRLFLIFEAVVFFIAAVVHSGIFSTAYRHWPTFIAEVLLMLAMGAAFSISLTRPRQTRLASMAAHILALLLTVIGIVTIATEIGTRTVPDAAYHVIMLLVLSRGLAISRKPLLETI